MISPRSLIRLIILVSGLALLATACGSAASPASTSQPLPTQAPPSATAQPPTATPEPAQRAAIDKLLQDLTSAGNFSGAALATRNGQIILSQGYGYADRSKKTRNTPQTKIRIGEVTQVFTAMAILMLQEQGKLNVQDKLCTYLKGCPAAWQEVTLEQLMLHNSGIPDTAQFNQAPDQILKSIQIWPLKFKPGSQYGYSHTGYIALGKVIETVSGQTYEAFLQQNIFGPLHMTNTGYDHGQGDLALAYTDNSDQAATLLDPQGLFASGALYSTAEDLYRWDQALYANPPVSAQSLQAMFSGHGPLDEPGWSLGYGYVIHLTGPHVAQVEALSTGISAVYSRFPDDQSVILLLANQQLSDPAGLSESITRLMSADQS